MDLGFISDDILLYSFRKCNHSSRFNLFHLLAQDIVQRIHEEHPRSYLWCNCMPSYWAETWRFGPKLRVSWAERRKYKWTKPKPSERMRTVKLQHFSHPLLLSGEIFWLKSNWVHLWWLDRTLYSKICLIGLRTGNNRCLTDEWDSHFNVILSFSYSATQVAQVVKNLLANAGTQVQSLGQEDPQEKEMATHSNIFAWEIPWAEEHGRPQTLSGVTKEADMTEQLNNNVYSN